MGRLEGKVVVITGAGGGMGRDAALLFSEEGASVCVADVDRPAAEETASEAREAFAVQVDVAESDSVQAMYGATAERYGGIDVLYNNAGISPADDDSILGTDEEAWQRVQDVNTKGVYLCCRHGIPYLLERGGGSVINVASFVARGGDLADLVHGIEGRRACDVARAWRAVRPAGRARQCAVPGTGRDPAPAPDLRRRPGRLRAATDPLADGEARETARDRERGALPGR